MTSGAVMAENGVVDGMTFLKVSDQELPVSGYASYRSYNS